MIYVSIYSVMSLLRWSLGGLAAARQHFYLPILILLFLFSAFRYDVGCDWSGYLNQFGNYKSVPLEEILTVNREPAWTGLFIFQGWAGLPYPWINVFSSAIFFGGIHALIRRQPDPFACLIFLFPILIINLPMSGIRQATAIGVLCLAFVSLEKKSLIQFVLWTLAAAAFHSSALVFLLLAPFVNGEYSLRRVGLAAVLAVPGAFFLLGTPAAELASERYIDSGVVSGGALFRVGALAITGAYFFLFLRPMWAKRFPEDLKLVSVGALLMMAMLALLPISTVIADRLVYFLIPIQAIIFARIPFFRLRRERPLHVAFPYVLLLVIFVSWMSLGTHFDQCYLPYQTWLFGYPEGNNLSIR